VTVKEGTLAIGASSTGNYEGSYLYGVNSGPLGTGTLKFETNETSPRLALADNGSYTLHNAIDLGCFSGTVTIDTGCGDLTLAGYITGSAGLTKVGPGTLTLQGDNEFEGDFKTKGGVVNAETDGALGYGTLAFCSSYGATVNFNSDCPTISGLSGTNCADLINLNGNCGPARLTIDQESSTSYAGKIAGAGGKVIKEGCGDLSLSGQSTFSGGFTLSEGSLLIGSSSTWDTDLSVVTSGPVGTGTLKLKTGTTLGVADTGSYTLHNAIDLGCFEGSVKVDTSCGNLTLTGYITGSAGLTKKGDGTLMLANGNSDFEGGVTVKQGTLAIGASSTATLLPPEGDSVGYYHISGPVGSGTLKFETNCTTPGLAQVDGSAYTLDNDIDLGCFEGTVKIDTNTGSLTLLGKITGTAGLTKVGSGILKLMDVGNDFEGGVTVKQGTLAIGGSSTATWMPPEEDSAGYYYITGPVGSGTLKFEASAVTPPTLALADSGTYTLHNDIDLGCFAGTVRIDTGNGNLTLMGVISGAADVDVDVNKLGAGTLTLKNDSDFEGDFYVSAGTVNADSNNALGGGALEFGTASGSSVNFTTANPVIHGLEGTSATDTVRLLGAPTLLTINQGNSSSFAGVIVGPGGSVVKQGTGWLTLSGPSTFDGGLTIEAGAIVLAGSSHTPDGNVIDFSPVGTGTLTIDDGAKLSVSGNGVTLLNNIVLAGAPGATQNFFTDVGNSLTIGNGTLGSISGDGRLNKIGLGTLTLATANTYTGGTSVGGGILEIANASALGSGNLTLDGGSIRLINGLHSITNNIAFDSVHGGTLAGNWTFGSLRTFGAGVTLSPGNSPGTMTFAAGFTPNNGVSTNLEFNAWTDAPGTNSDLIAVTGGALDLTSLGTNGYTLKLISLSLTNSNTQGAIDGTAAATKWTIFQSATDLSATFDSTKFALDASQFYGGGTFVLTLAANNHDIMLNFTPVPEPSTYALLGLGLGLSGLAAWRKRRRA